MAGVLEAAMQERRKEAIAAAEERYPEATQIIVSFFGTDVIVDLQPEPRAEWIRFPHVVEEDRLAAEAAEASSRIKVVRQGRLT
jgi:hypothetical protein